MKINTFVYVHQPELQFSTVTPFVALLYARVSLHDLVNLNLCMFVRCFSSWNNFANYVV